MRYCSNFCAKAGSKEAASPFSTKSHFANCREVFLNELVPTSSSALAPDNKHLKIRLTLIEQGIRVVAFQSTVVDDRGYQSQISFYNFPGSGTAGSFEELGSLSRESFDLDVLSEKGRHFLKPGTRILLRNPWYKVQRDMNLGLRVENPKDVAILNPRGAGACYHCDAEAQDGLQLRRCGRCLAVFYCSTECQAKSWAVHRRFCTSAAENQAAHGTK